MGINLTNRYPFLRNWRFLVAIGLPIAMLPLPIIGQTKTAYAGYCLTIIAVYWMSEALPIAVTALLPVVLYPLFGICDTDLIAREYLKDSIMVFIGSLNIALAFEYCNLHKRVALQVVLWTGVSPARLMFGVMFTTMFLSMWMFNTAATAMMVPIISTIVDELEAGVKAFSDVQVIKTDHDDDAIEIDDTDKEVQRQTQRSEDYYEMIQRSSTVAAYESQSPEMSPDGKPSHSSSDNGNDSVDPARDAKREKRLLKLTQDMRSMYLLSICYSANIGGTGVVTGSGTNIVALEFIGNLDPKHHGDYAVLSFATWMAFNIPPMLINIVVAWLYLLFVFLGLPNNLKFWLSKDKRTQSNSLFSNTVEQKIHKLVEEKYAALGPMNLHEALVSIVFLITVVSWILHEPKFITGWSEWFTPTKVSLSTSSLLFATLFFVIPRNAEFYMAFVKRDFKGVAWKPLVDYEYVVEKFPWGSILLLGGGYALSLGTRKSGLSALAGQSLTSLGTLPPAALQLIVMVLIGFVTEVASNAATASITIPVLLQLSKELNLHPFYLTLPSAITCSYAFMLPVATIPNAIVYAASTMSVTQMIKVGFFMNCACILVLFVSINFYGPLFFNFNDYLYTP